MSQTDQDTELSARFYKTYLDSYGVERQKLLVFGMVYSQKTLIVKSPDDKNGERKFLGYTWSDRRGQEGIQIENAGGMLYDGTMRRASETIAAGIRDSYADEVPFITRGEEYAKFVSLKDLMDFSRAKFDKAISMTARRRGKLPRGMCYLDSVAAYAKKRIPFSSITPVDYITTDNMIQNRCGIIPYAGKAIEGNVVQYKKGDTLISNIRPYLKKIWLADRDGGCSPDVLVLRVKDKSVVLPEYLNVCLSMDEFFTYTMEGKTGVKMPRGDKDEILRYGLNLPTVQIQEKIIAECATLDAECSQQKKVLEGCLKDRAMIFGRIFDGSVASHDEELSAYVRVVRGVTYSKEDQVYYKTDNAILTADNISLDGAYNLRKCVYLKEDIVIDEEKKLVEGDCFICMSSGSISHVGKSTRIRKSEGYFAGGFMGILRADGINVMSEYLSGLLSTDKYREILRSKSSGANIKNLSNEIGSILIPCPTIVEQKKIAGLLAKIESRFEKARDIVESIAVKKAAVLKKYLKKS